MDGANSIVSTTQMCTILGVATTTRIEYTRLVSGASAANFFKAPLALAFGGATGSGGSGGGAEAFPALEALAGAAALAALAGAAALAALAGASALAALAAALAPLAGAAALAALAGDIVVITRAYYKMATDEGAFNPETHLHSTK